MAVVTHTLGQPTRQGPNGVGTELSAVGLKEQRCRRPGGKVLYWLRRSPCEGLMSLMLNLVVVWYGYGMGMVCGCRTKGSGLNLGH